MLIFLQVHGCVPWLFCPAFLSDCYIRQRLRSTIECSHFAPRAQIHKQPTKVSLKTSDRIEWPKRARRRAFGCRRGEWDRMKMKSQTVQWKQRSHKIPGFFIQKEFVAVISTLQASPFIWCAAETLPKAKSHTQYNTHKRSANKHARRVSCRICLRKMRKEQAIA